MNPKWASGDWSDDGLPILTNNLPDLWSLLRTEMAVESSNPTDKKGSGKSKKQDHGVKNAEPITQHEQSMRSSPISSAISRGREQQKKKPDRYQDRAANIEKQKEKEEAAEEQSARNASFSVKILVKIERMTVRQRAEDLERQTWDLFQPHFQFKLGGRAAVSGAFAEAKPEIEEESDDEDEYHKAAGAVRLEDDESMSADLDIHIKAWRLKCKPILGNRHKDLVEVP